MGIGASVYSRPAKFSTIIADADLDIGAQAILTTNLSLFEAATDYLQIKNRAKTVFKHLTVSASYNNSIFTDTIGERTGPVGVIIDGLLIKDDKIREFDGIGGNVMPKIVSDNLRNSHDAEVDTPSTGATYVKVKTMTFTYGVKGTLRIKYDLKDNVGYIGYGRVYKNGVALGAEKTGTDNYVTESEDIAVGTIAAGETLELWVKAEHASCHTFIRNFRCYYDDDSGTAVMVTS